MSAPDLLVLDVHGVVLSNPLPAFLDRVADLTGRDRGETRARWKREVRLPAWTGAIEDAELWRRLTGEVRPSRDWRALLEESYELGPVAPHLERWREHASIWLLSNHRSHWLWPRLDRFGLSGLFDRVLVSDRIGHAKPDPAAFAPLLEAARSAGSILFLDDRARNVTAARALGLRALQVAPGTDWLDRVNATYRSRLRT